MQKSKLSYEEKIAAVQKYNEGKGSYESIAKECGVYWTTIRLWKDRYDTIGAEGHLSQKRNKRYSKELKEAAVLEYISGQGSLIQICKKYKILNERQLRNWIKVYNGHKEFREVGETGEIYMTKGRKTTFEERLDIVKYCIENRNDYARTINEFQVSYQQIYSWVKTYEQSGVEALTDRRGKAKSEEMLTELDKLKAENKLLQAKLIDSEIEIKLLKKLKELEMSGR